jgi:hypothetical protein
MQLEQYRVGGRRQQVLAPGAPLPQAFERFAERFNVARAHLLARYCLIPDELAERVDAYVALGVSERCRTSCTTPVTITRLALPVGAATAVVEA